MDESAPRAPALSALKAAQASLAGKHRAFTCAVSWGR